MGELTAYLAALWRQRRRSSQGLRRHQERLWHRFQSGFDAYPALAPYRSSPFKNIPITSVADYRHRFDSFNALGLTWQSASRSAEATQNGATSDLPDGLNAGFSTGTSGMTRGLFVTSPKERADYTGQILAKLFTPLELIGLKRVALCLRAPNALYRNSHIDVRFFPLSDNAAPEISAFDPEVLIAPPQVLLELATRHTMTSLKHLFYGAETLNTVERNYIAQKFRVRPDPIYQATEGFLGAACRYGTLHLNEENLIIEREPLKGDRFRPIVTDLLRRTQAIVRLRLDDILQATTCQCGAAHTAVMPIEGRIQDIWNWGEPVFPRQVEELIAPSLPAQAPWMVTANARGLAYACSDEYAAGVSTALQAFNRPTTRVPYEKTWDYPKRRHVRWQA